MVVFRRDESRSFLLKNYEVRVVQKDIELLWRDVLGSSSEFLPPGTSDMWLTTCLPLSLEEGVLSLSVPNIFSY